MSSFEIGDIVVLSSGSMRMAVESIDGETVNTVWCNEGTIGRDSFHTVLLRKWEVREDGGRDGGRPPRSGKPGGHGGGDRGGDRGRGDRDDKPRGKPGWDGKPREKKYFRKD